jgi:hypothetical protein
MPFGTARPRGPVGVWLVAGTPLRDRYPCTCRGTRECGRRCWCRGRLDAAATGTACCSRRGLENRIPKTSNTQEVDEENAGHSVGVNDIHNVIHRP